LDIIGLATLRKVVMARHFKASSSRLIKRLIPLWLLCPLEATMKKTLLLTGVLLALTASFASAAGLNLSWNGCGTAGVQNTSDLCDENTLLNSWHLFGSAQCPQQIATGTPLFTAHRSWVDFQNAAPTLDDWWKMAPGDCRAGQYAPSHTSATMGGGAPCVKTILGTGNTAAINNWGDNAGSNPANTARLDMIAARADTGGTVNTTNQYMLFDLNILGSYAVADPNDETAPVCHGCMDAACIVYQQAEFDRSDGSGITTSGPLGGTGRNWATWQGGAVPGSGCPLAVPTQNGTWGKLKSLYR
jgi:hypothetical protein